MKVKALKRFENYRLISLQATYGKIDNNQFRELKSGKMVDVDNSTAEKMIAYGIVESVVEIKKESIKEKPKGGD